MSGNTVDALSPVDRTQDPSQHKYLVHLYMQGDHVLFVPGDDTGHATYDALVRNEPVAVLRQVRALNEGKEPGPVLGDFAFTPTSVREYQDPLMHILIAEGTLGLYDSDGTLLKQMEDDFRIGMDTDGSALVYRKSRRVLAMAIEVVEAETEAPEAADDAEQHEKRGQMLDFARKPRTKKSNRIN